ncbi:ferredoxin--NADP reductase [Gordonia namibiensis]|nr:ferredoxin--NADP reductase [Gordonia namibiensis]
MIWDRIDGRDDRRGRRVRVVGVVDETHDTRSLLVEPAPEDTAAFGYSAGQFLTIRVPDQGRGGARCYSLASSPHVDTTLKVTVKRVHGGHGSNWVCDTITSGDELEVLPPAGTFGPKSLDESVVLIAGGSGITPVISIAKSILVAGSGHVALIYANRDERSVVFAEELRELADRHGTRFSVVHLLDSVQGRPTGAGLSALLQPYLDRQVYVCGPPPLMDLVASVCEALGIERGRVHAERFVSLQGNPFDAAGPVGDEAPEDDDDPGCSVEVHLDGESHVVPWRGRKKLLDALLEAGLDAPFSCREGACSACVCSLTSGEVRLAHNEILSDDEIAEGYILACQAESVGEKITIEY